MTFWQRVACFFGFHPANRRVLIHEEAWYVSGCNNGETSWVEKCPRCGRWHYAPFRESLYRGDSPEAKQIHTAYRACGWEW